MIDTTLLSKGLNPYFEGFIPERVDHDDNLFGESNQWMRIAYLDEQGARLLVRCRAHVEQFRSGRGTRGAVVIGHPFYTVLEHPGIYLADAGYQQAVETVVGNLAEVISHLDRKRFELVFVDVPEHYARFNSWFLEAGLIDDVVFTESNSGYIITNDNSRRWIQRMAGKDVVYFGGEYEDDCAKSTLETLGEFVGRSKVKVVPELLLPTLRLYQQRLYRGEKVFGDGVSVGELCAGGKLV